ncbi:hypothetical protein ACOSP7_027195 [Xanthoceras sorbifolium]
MEACNGWLPTNVNLFKHRVPLELNCPRCHLLAESSIHALWFCSKLGGVRDSCASLLQMPPPLNENVPFLEVVLWAYQQVPSQAFVTFASFDDVFGALKLLSFIQVRSFAS